MRAAPYVALAAIGVLAACADTTTRQVSAAPPTVSYQVVGTDLTQANADAGRYCAQYGMAAQLYGTQPSGNGSVASYGCVTGSTYGSNTGYGPAPVYAPQPVYNPPVYTSTAPVYGSTTPVVTTPPVYGTTTVECADFFHQSRPGGSNYTGPPVPGCPQQ